MTRNRLSPIVEVLVLLVLVLAPVRHAEAFIYWTSADSIGRGNLDGTGVNPRFIHRGGDSGDIAVDLRHLYWTVAPSDYTDPGEIARASLDGTKVDKNFISASGPLAVDRDHIFWSWNGGHPAIFTSAIGRANVTGTGADRGFLSLADPVGGVAVDAGHIYWGQWPDPICCPPGLTPTYAIGRANIDGTAPEPAFLSLGRVVPAGLAVDAAHLYWITAGPNEEAPRTIARANLDGSGVDQTFITGDPSAFSPVDLAVDADHVYWASPGESAIGRARIDGANVDERFIALPAANSPRSVAVDALTDTRLKGRASAARTQRQTGKRIVVKVRVKAKEKLTAKVTGQIQVNPAYKLKSQKAKLNAGETKTLKLKPKRNSAARKIARALKRGEKATARLAVRLSDRVGNRESERLRVKLKR